METFSFLKYFYNLAAERLGAGEAGSHFIAITDPGSALAEIAAAHRFRHCFLNDPEIGGRYSALSFFGLVPAALIGMDVEGFLGRAAAAAEGEFATADAVGEESGAFLGALLGETGDAGPGQAHLLFSRRRSPPSATGSSNSSPRARGRRGRGSCRSWASRWDRLRPTATTASSWRSASGRTGRAKRNCGLSPGRAIPSSSLGWRTSVDLGAQCFFWEMATAVAGWRLAINPFDQPDVEAAKALARRMIGVYRETGELPPETPSLEVPGISVYGDVAPCAPGAALIAFLEQAGPGAYAAIQAYLRPCPETGAALEAFRLRLRERFGLPVTVGYGPRFLHSTGQLHKGDAGRGLFIQLTADDPRDAPIPDEIELAGGVAHLRRPQGGAGLRRPAGPDRCGPPRDPLPPARRSRRRHQETWVKGSARNRQGALYDPNRLRHEKSPYLLQHAENPVDWYPWGEEAFARAAREDKPIFLSIGYSTCHWCHVMAHESFEDETVAALLNEAFVCIKVDREERPDIDGIYMTVCQMMTGSGGWPLTVVMTPDRRPFFAATYIPKESRWGRMGLVELIPAAQERLGDAARRGREGRGGDGCPPEAAPGRAGGSPRRRAPLPRR